MKDQRLEQVTSLIGMSERYVSQFVGFIMSAKETNKHTMQYIIKSLIAGGIAGSAAKTVIAPFDR